MRNLISLIILISIVFVWLFPIVISIYKDEYWHIFLYAVWWLPAGIFTGFILKLFDRF